MRNFVYKVTPRGLEQQLIDACEEATRSVARTLQHTEVYGLRTDISGKKAQLVERLLQHMRATSSRCSPSWPQISTIGDGTCY